MDVSDLLEPYEVNVSRTVLRGVRDSDVPRLPDNWGTPDLKRQQMILLTEDKWQKKYEELKSFKKRYRHCRVPQGWKENPSLGDWVGKQRRGRKLNKIPDHRIKLLDKLGFVWDASPVNHKEKKLSKKNKRRPVIKR